MPRHDLTKRNVYQSTRRSHHDCVAGALLFSMARAGDKNSLWKIQQILASETYVNLTHEFQPAFPAGQDFRMRHARQYTGTKNDQTPRLPDFSPSSSRMSVNSGTHVDPPAHFIKGLCTVDQIDLKEMILPLVVVDVHEEAAKNPDYTSHSSA